MTRCYCCHGKDGHEIRDTPIQGHEGRDGQDHDGDDEEQRERDRIFELKINAGQFMLEVICYSPRRNGTYTLENLGNLNEEVGELGLLGRGAPGHVYLEHMRKDSLADVQRETTEEDSEEESPLEVLVEGVEQSPLADTVAHDGERDVTKTVEHDDDGEPDLPGVDVVLVQVAVEPAHEEVVDRSEDPGRADGVVRPDVRDDRDLGGEADVGEQEAAEQGGEGPLPEPHADRVEEQLVAAVSVFLPSRELVVHGQRHALLEAVAGPGREPDDVPVALQAQRHVEILGDVGFGPELLVAVFVFVGDLLDRAPAEDGVVADEGGHVAVGDRVADGRVDEVREEGDAVFEVRVDNLHDARRELHDAYVRGLLHLRHGVQKTIRGYTGIRID